MPWRQLLLAAWAAFLPFPLSADSGAFEIPHRRARLHIDGDAADWPSTAARVEFARPAARGEPTARVVVRLAWDSGSLWALFEVQDSDVHLAPPGVAGAALFQWDSVEIYVDGRGDRERRMGPDDFQFILAPDGRSAVLQGDPLLHELELMEVPKRERPALAIEVAGRRTADGYLVECALPFAALGVVPRRGLSIALDLALNDWLADHPPLEQIAYDLETLHKLERIPAGDTASFDANGLAVGGAERVEAALYRPWSWSGSDDFGHPGAWRSVRLVGTPPLAERVVATLGVARTLVAGGVATVALVALVASASEWRHRRRIAALLARLNALEAQLAWPADAAPAAPGPAAATATARAAASPRRAPTPPDPFEWLGHAAEREPSPGLPERLELRALRAVRDRLDRPLPPAELAEALFVSLRTLERHLAETLSCTPRELILAIKMRTARRFLEQGAWQVQEVARRVGYDDPSHFSRRFKAYFGLSPAAAAARAAAPGARQPAA